MKSCCIYEKKYEELLKNYEKYAVDLTKITSSVVQSYIEEEMVISGEISVDGQRWTTYKPEGIEEYLPYCKVVDEVIINKAGIVTIEYTANNNYEVSLLYSDNVLNNMIIYNPSSDKTLIFGGELKRVY